MRAFRRILVGVVLSTLVVAGCDPQSTSWTSTPPPGTTETPADLTMGATELARRLNLRVDRANSSLAVLTG